MLSVHYAGALLQSGELEGLEDRLQDAERWLNTIADVRERPEAPSASMVVWTKRSFAVSPAQSPCTAPDRPWFWAM